MIDLFHRELCTQQCWGHPPFSLSSPHLSLSLSLSSTLLPPSSSPSPSPVHSSLLLPLTWIYSVIKRIMLLDDRSLPQRVVEWAVRRGHGALLSRIWKQSISSPSPLIPVSSALSLLRFIFSSPLLSPSSLSFMQFFLIIKGVFCSFTLLYA